MDRIRYITKESQIPSEIDDQTIMMFDIENAEMGSTIPLSEKCNCSPIEIIDSLDSEDTTKVLSANQGRILNERLKSLEEAPENSTNVKKDTLKFYKILGKTNSDLKPYADSLRASMIGLDEFAKLGTGLFIHWGIYSVPAGNYSGTRQSGSTITSTKISYNTEWIMRDLSIPKNIYKNFQTQFTSTNWDPETLCKLASEAGMGYVVITIKHHEGFSLYPTEFGSWDVRTSGARETILDELKTACDKYHLKFGIYFSQYWDWMAEGGFGLEYQGKWNGSVNDIYTSDQHLSYCRNAVLQINEAVEKYKPFLLWYDPGVSYESQYVDIFLEGDEDLYPHIITNDRLNYNRNYGDYGTGERTLYLNNKLKYGETCFTMNDTWGYSDNNENKYFGIEKIMKQFILYSLSYGQNCLMNIGPKSDGSIPEKQIELLGQIKTFCNSFGQFKNYKRVMTSAQPKWGYLIELNNNKLLCYIFNKDNTNIQSIKLDCIDVKNITAVNILTPGDNASYEITDNNIIINNLALDSTTNIGVVQICYGNFISILDANYFRVEESISSRVFLMVKNASWNFNDLSYYLKPSSKIVHSTEFIWDDETEIYNFELDCDIVDSNPSSLDDITTVEITDKITNESTTVTFNHGVFSSETEINLEKNKRYILTVKCSGTNTKNLYKFNGFKFKSKIIHVSSVLLNKTEVYVTEEGTEQLTATILPENATYKNIIWSSEDESIATVEDGLIIGLKAGETTVIATSEDGNKTAQCSVIVTPMSTEDIIPVSGVSLNKTTLTLSIESVENLSATVSPENATYQSITWESSDTSIATVSSTGLVTAVDLGTVTITAISSYDNTKFDTCVLTVTGIYAESISLNKNTISLIPGYEETLVANILPLNTTYKNITWNSNDPDKVSVDENGKITAKKPGTIEITATTENGLTSTCTVTVLQESYDYIFEALSMEATENQGENTGLKIFSDELSEWTLFGYVHDSINSYRPGTTTFDSNQTLYQCVVDSSPWSGVRVDANNNISKVLGVHVPERFRFMAGTDNYVSSTTGQLMTSSFAENVEDEKHPICFSRNGNVYKFSADGINWTEFTGLNITQLNRLKNCILTVGFDYTRSSGSITTTKYRFLKTERPCCVAFKTVSEYPYYTLYHKYDNTLI